MTATRDVIERRDKIARQANGLEQQVHALRAETMRLEVERKRLDEEVFRLGKYKDELRDSTRKAKAELERLNDTIGITVPEADAAQAERMRRLWAERYGEDPA